MSDVIKEIFADQFHKCEAEARAQGEAEGRAKGEAEGRVSKMIEQIMKKYKKDVLWLKQQICWKKIRQSLSRFMIYFGRTHRIMTCRKYINYF